jgi:hypothetical protein
MERHGAGPGGRLQSSESGRLREAARAGAREAMMWQHGEGGSPTARVVPGPGAGSIDLPAVAHCNLDIVPCILPVNTLVVRLRGNKFLRQLAFFSGPDRRRSSARFITYLAVVSSLLTTIACDVLFLCFSRQPERDIQRRHGPALQAFKLLH